MIPAVEGDGYVEMGPLEPEQSERLDLSVSFKPFADDGLILYAPGPGEDSGRGDFVSVSLREGKVVYRWDVGGGVGETVSEHGVSLGDWHTVSVSRDGQTGRLTVDGEFMSEATAPGDQSEANLGDSVFLGGAPDLPSKDTKRIGADTGMKGRSCPDREEARC